MSSIVEMIQLEFQINQSRYAMLSSRLDGLDRTLRRLRDEVREVPAVLKQTIACISG